MGAHDKQHTQITRIAMEDSNGSPKHYYQTDTHKARDKNQRRQHNMKIYNFSKPRNTSNPKGYSNRQIVFPKK